MFDKVAERIRMIGLDIRPSNCGRRKVVANSKPFFLPILAFCFAATAKAQSAASGNISESKESVLKATDIPSQLFPERVFYEGKTAPTEYRNTGRCSFCRGYPFPRRALSTLRARTHLINRIGVPLLSLLPDSFRYLVIQNDIA
jgi:hypothetical protein